jgi:hypothetical protein
MSKNSQVAEKKQTAVSVIDEAMFEQDQGKGLENVGMEDLALPFLKVLSRQDPLLDDLENAKAGDIYNTVTGDIFKGKEGVKVVPCAYQRRLIEWAPRGQGTGAPVNIFDPKVDTLPKTERSKEDNREYLTDGSGHYVEDTHQHYVVVVKDDGTSSTALIAMKSTQLKKSRKWNSMIQSRVMTKKDGSSFQPPRFAYVYNLKTVSEENSKGSWHGWDISLDSQIESANLYNQAKAFAESINKGEVEVKHTREEESSEKDDNVPF